MIKLIISIVLLVSICVNFNVFSQKSKNAKSGNSESKCTEYDYYEKLRLERKDKSVKTISSFSTFNDAIENKDYYDENGYLRKREVYGEDLMGVNRFVWKEIFNITYDETGNIFGNFTEFKNNTEILSNSILNNLSPSDFYDIGFSETLVDEVKYIFDDKNNLIEKRIYGDHLYGTRKEYESEFFYYDRNNRLIESKYPSANTISISKYYYNEKGLIDRINVSYEFQNGGRNYGSRYEYEYYKNDKSNGIQIYVMSFDNIGTIECVEDYYENNPIEYEGAFLFERSGSEYYVFQDDNNKIKITRYYESLSTKDSSSFEEIRFDQNWVYATNSFGNELKARFVKLKKCIIKGENWEGLIGLLVNEELLYISQGD